MKKRNFLLSGASILGGAWLYQIGRSPLDSSSNSSNLAIALDNLDNRNNQNNSNTISNQENQKYKVMKTEDEWKEILTPEQFYVLRKHGTERAFTSPLDKEYGKGIYKCAGCGQELFTSDTKFNSGTGWPSFFAPIEGAIATKSDNSFFMRRTEVHCSRCGGHLGHVFNDGPKPTGQRYCMNGVSLSFIAEE